MEEEKVKMVGHEKKTEILNWLLTGEREMKVTMIGGGESKEMDALGVYNVMTNSNKQWMPVIGLEVHRIVCKVGEVSKVVQIWDIDSNYPEYGRGINKEVEVSEEETCETMKEKMKRVIGGWIEE